MDAQHYAEFLQRIGHMVHEAAGVHWFDVKPHVYTCFPFETQLNPAAVDFGTVLGSRGLAARYCCRVSEGVSSYRLVVRDRDYDLASQTSKARNQTRRGLEQCQYGRLEFSQLADDGLRLNRETLLRQQRSIPGDFERYWRDYYSAADRCPAATAWGAWHDGMLASYLISFRIGAVENICIVRSDRSTLKHYPNNAMLYSFLKHAMERGDVSEVSIGFQSLLEGMEPLDHFKLGLGFEKQPIGQRIEFRRTLGLAVPKSLAALTGRALKRWSEHERLGRISGMLAWYASQPVIRKAA
ncbi:MAG: GNAT family N-acetyltransferase [Planctomycetaceae bacterium]